MIDACMPPPDRIERVMTKAVLATFEAMVFSEPEIQGDAKFIDSPTLGASLQVTSPYSMTIALALPLDLARQLAAIIFRHEENRDDLVVLRDAVGEVLNTLVGLFLQRLVPADQLFSMGFPESWQAEEASGLGAVQRYAFQVEGHPLRLFVFVNTPTADVVGRAP